MIDAQFEQLLYEEESPTLDFKRDQYLFAKASEEEKSELLKDILGMASAWRRSERISSSGSRMCAAAGRASVASPPTTTSPTTRYSNL